MLEQFIKLSTSGIGSGVTH